VSAVNDRAMTGHHPVWAHRPARCQDNQRPRGRWDETESPAELRAGPTCATDPPERLRLEKSFNNVPRDKAPTAQLHRVQYPALNPTRRDGYKLAFGDVRQAIAARPPTLDSSVLRNGTDMRAPRVH